MSAPDLAKGRLLPLEQAAERTGLSVDTLRRRIYDGTLPAYRMGSRVVRVYERDLAALFQRVQSAGDA